jgi:hypothetical protein
MYAGGRRPSRRDDKKPPPKRNGDDPFSLMICKTSALPPRSDAIDATI